MNGDLIQCTEFVSAPKSEESQLLPKVLRYIEKNYAQECSLKSAAEKLSYGYTYLSRMFKRYMQMSYTEYLNKYRINCAVYLLNHENNIQIQEIAERCGYDSLCSFNRNFKHFTGCTPREMLKGDFETASL